MKICIFTGIFPPDIGGPATYVKRLAEELNNRGFKTCVLTYGNKETCGADYNFKVFQVWRKYPKLIKHLLYFLKGLMLAKDSDIVYCQNLFSVGIPGLFVSKILRKKMVVKIVGDYVWEQAITKRGIKDSIDEFQKKKYSLLIELGKVLQSFLANKTDKIITPSFYLKSIVRGWGVPEQKISVVYNAIEPLEGFEISKKEAKEKIGIKGDIILSIGRLSIWKGFNALVEIMPFLIKENDSFRLVIVGEGEERKNLEKKIENLDLKDVVHLVGRINHKEIPLYFKAADIFVLNSGYEGLSHTILEAMQMGVPIIASNKGGNPELIQDGVNGFLVEYNNKEQIKDVIFKLWKDKNLQEKFVKNSKEKLKYFSFEKMIKNTLEVLRN